MSLYKWETRNGIQHSNKHLIYAAKYAEWKPWGRHKCSVARPPSVLREPLIQFDSPCFLLLASLPCHCDLLFCSLRFFFKLYADFV